VDGTNPITSTADELYLSVSEFKFCCKISKKEIAAKGFPEKTPQCKKPVDDSDATI
jgi:hypothetical protein